MPSHGITSRLSGIARTCSPPSGKRQVAAALFAVLLVFAAACACRREPAGDQHTALPERTLVGQLSLPSGSGSRGVEVLVKVTASGSEPRVVLARPI